MHMHNIWYFNIGVMYVQVPVQCVAVCFAMCDSVIQCVPVCSNVFKCVPASAATQTATHELVYLNIGVMYAPVPAATSVGSDAH